MTTTVTPKPAICRVSTGDEKNRFLGSSPDLINPSAQSLFIGCSLCLGISISQPGLGTTGLEHLNSLRSPERGRPAQRATLFAPRNGPSRLTPDSPGKDAAKKRDANYRHLIPPAGPGSLSLLWALAPPPTSKMQTA